MPRHTTIDGIILRRANVGEADRIVTLLTKQGKMAVVARGIRKLASRKAGSLELFHRVRMLLSETHSLPVISEVELLCTYPRLREDLHATTYAFWAAELIDRLVEEGAGGALYPFTERFLERIEAGATQLDLFAFQMLVLGELGWRPELHQCAHCSDELTPDALAWSHSHGGVLDVKCATSQGISRLVSADAIKVLRLLADQHLSISQRLMPSPAVVSEVGEIMHHYLETLAERRFRTLELLQN